MRDRERKPEGSGAQPTSTAPLFTGAFLRYSVILTTRPRATRMRSAAFSSRPRSGSPLLMLRRSGRSMASSKITGTSAGRPMRLTAPCTQPVMAGISFAEAKCSRRHPSPSAAGTALGATRPAPLLHTPWHNARPGPLRAAGSTSPSLPGERRVAGTTRPRSPPRRSGRSRPLARAVFADGLADRQNVILVEAVTQQRAAVSRRADGHGVRGLGRVGMVGIVCRWAICCPLQSP